MLWFVVYWVKHKASHNQAFKKLFTEQALEISWDCCSSKNYSSLCNSCEWRSSNSCPSMLYWLIILYYCPYKLFISGQFILCCFICFILHHHIMTFAILTLWQHNKNLEYCKVLLQCNNIQIHVWNFCSVSSGLLMNLKHQWKIKMSNKMCPKVLYSCNTAIIHS